MIRFAAVAALLGVALTPSLAGTPLPPMRPPLTGGWARAEPGSGDVLAAARFAVSHLPDRRAKLRTVDAAEQQVVAGMNYRVTLTLTNKSRWRVTVWRQIGGAFKLTDSARLR